MINSLCLNDNEQNWSHIVDSNSSPKLWCLEPHSVVAKSVGRCSERGRECNVDNSSGICVVPVLPPGEILAELYFSQGNSTKTVLYAGTTRALWNSSLCHFFPLSLSLSYVSMV